MQNEQEKFEMNLRVLNNDLLGFSIESQSSRKNWVFIGAVMLVVISVVANNLWPIIEPLIK